MPKRASEQRRRAVPRTAPGEAPAGGGNARRRRPGSRCRRRRSARSAHGPAGARCGRKAAGILAPCLPLDRLRKRGAWAFAVAGNLAHGASQRLAADDGRPTLVGDRLVEWSFCLARLAEFPAHARLRRGHRLPLARCRAARARRRCARPHARLGPTTATSASSSGKPTSSTARSKVSDSTRSSTAPRSSTSGSPAATRAPTLRTATSRRWRSCAKRSRQTAGWC